MNKWKKLLWLFPLAIALTACGKKISGTYQDSDGIARYEFQPNGKVNAMGMEMDYKIEDNKVKVLTGQGPAMVFDIQDDGSLKNPLITLRQKQ